MSQPFAPGDVVQLKSGGPIMTVAFLGVDGDVNVTWFDKNEPKNGRYPPAVLTKYEAPSVGVVVGRTRGSGRTRGF